MSNNEFVHIQVGSKKVFEVLAKRFSNKRYCHKLIHTNIETGEIVIENTWNTTLDDLAGLSTLYPRTYVQVEIYYKTYNKISETRYIINDGVVNKIFATYDYVPDYLIGFR